MSFKRAIWIDRGWQPVAIGFCPSEKAWNREVKRLNGTQPWPEGASVGGYTMIGVNDVSGQATILVAIGRGAERDAHEVIMTLVHEAVHVWQFLCSHIGERAPGIEMEAYGVEQIARGLIDAYCKTSGKDKKWP